MKFMIVVLFAVILAANAKRPKLSDIVKAYEETNEIGESAPEAKHALYIPVSRKRCSNSYCKKYCIELGARTGRCESFRKDCVCTFYNFP